MAKKPRDDQQGDKPAAPPGKPKQFEQGASPRPERKLVGKGNISGPKKGQSFRHQGR